VRKYAAIEVALKTERNAIMLKKPLLLFILLWALVLTACADSAENEREQPATSVGTPTVAAAPETAEYRTLSIDEFADILANQADDYIVVNVHIPYEGEVEGTDTHVPYNEIDALTSALPEKTAAIILYCRSGRMSEEASRALVDLGYTQVWDVPGGMNAWQLSGREVLYND
jgi:rhodanese-related sulfurtransferase